MDLNYLLHRHQVSLALSTRAKGREARHAHAGMATRYGQQVDALRASKFPADHVLGTLTEATKAVLRG